MKRIFKTLAITTLLSSLPALAGESVEVSVRGVDSSQDERIQQILGAQKAISKIEIVTGTKLLKLELENGRVFSDEQIQAVVAGAGYEVVTIKRPKSAPGHRKTEREFSRIRDF
jgi:hypothetical protein